MQASAESAIQLALIQLGVPEVNRPAVAGLMFFYFHTPGALPQALM